MTNLDNRHLEETFDRVRDDLKRLANARLDRRLSGRVDSSDIVQDTCLLAFQRYPEYVAKPEVSLVQWLRFLTLQTVTQAHRFHLGRLKRSIRREAKDATEDLCVAKIVDTVADSLTSPQSASIKKELRQAVSELIEAMSATDREIIRLRHEELLSNDECAAELGLSSSAASKRYIRALKRLQSIANEFMK